jgi:hypothetical protein
MTAFETRLGTRPTLRVDGSSLSIRPYPVIHESATAPASAAPAVGAIVARVGIRWP